MARVIGPILAGVFHDVAGSYLPAFLLFLFCLMLGALLVLRTRPPGIPGESPVGTRLQPSP